MTRTIELLSAVGGLGLFLLGMIVLTEGLRGLAGGSLRRLLTRFTRTPTSGAMTGAVVTALVQSSSATTVAAVGFVGAGLLTFAQALGIIFGANIGTTITGWLVALIGFKLDLALAALPLVLLGVLLRLFGRGRVRHVGWATVGFSLLFLGIASMQEGMASLEGVVTPEDFPDDSLWGRLQLLGLGIGITLITQSSSAGIATALVALGAGAISFPQAAAMVIGMDVGTTFTAALATLGGSLESRRTGFAHVIYNLLTGTVAFLLLDPYLTLVAPWIGSGLRGDPQVALVAFHTSFNALGVVLVLPFAESFARLILWLVPEKGSATLLRLDDRLLADPDAALDAATQTLVDLTAVAFTALRSRLDGEVPEAGDVDDFHTGLDSTRGYLERIRTDPLLRESHFRHQEALHTLDHLARLALRLEETPPIGGLRDDEELGQVVVEIRQVLARGVNRIDASFERDLELLWEGLKNRRGSFREQTIELAARSETSGKDVLERLDSFRWLSRITDHAWRISHHLRQVAGRHPIGQPVDGRPVDGRPVDGQPVDGKEDKADRENQREGKKHGEVD